MLWILSIYTAGVIILSWKNFRTSIALLILCLPTYLIRAKIGPLPTSVLEVTWGAVILVWLIRYARTDWGQIVGAVKSRPRFFVLVALFFVASIAGIFVSGWDTTNYWSNIYKALGIWRAYFFEPMVLFFVLLGRIKNNALLVEDVVKFLIWSGISVALVAISQKLFGWPYAPSLWNDVLGNRATSFFTSPNAVGLYLGPLVVLAIIRFLKNETIADSLWTFLFVLAIIFSWSQGAWLALVAAAVVVIFLLGKRKTAIVLVLLGMAVALYWGPVRNAVTFSDRASQNRLVLWGYSWQYFTASPARFVGGAGLRQFFGKIQYPFFIQNSKMMEKLIYPHNFFINFWSEIGLIGALSFLGIGVYLFLMAAHIFRQDRVLGAGLVGLLVVYFVHGLVDVPYFKNDLSFIFWLYVLVLFLSNNYHAGGSGART